MEGRRIAQRNLQVCVYDHVSTLRKKGAIEIINIDDFGPGLSFE